MNEEIEQDFFYCMECPTCKHRRYDVWITGAGMNCTAPDRECGGKYAVRILESDPFDSIREEEEK